MKYTEQQLQDYMAGKLKLMMNRKTGERYFVPAKPRPYDKGVTPPEKRAYWRVWYLLNHEERRAKEKDRYKNAKKRVKKGDWPGREANRLRLPTIPEAEQAKLLAKLPPVDPKTGRRKRGSLTAADRKVLKRLRNAEYRRTHAAELALKARQRYAKQQDKPAPKPAPAKKQGFFARLLGFGFGG